MDKGDITFVVTGVLAALFAAKTLVELADAAEKTAGYWRRMKQLGRRLAVYATVNPSRFAAKLLNHLWVFLTGHPIIVVGDDLPPSPSGGRRSRSGPIAFVGYRAHVCEPKVLGGRGRVAAAALPA